MIYNLIQYLMTEFPAEIIYANERISITGQVVPDRCVVISETGGAPQAWTEYTEKTFQVLSRDASTPKARQLAFSVFDKIQSRFGLELPSVTVDGVLYNSIQGAQISAIQEPYCLGSDAEGRTEFTQNFMVIYTRP